MSWATEPAGESHLPPSRPPRPSEADRAIWASYVGSIAPLPGRSPGTVPPQPPPAPPPPAGDPSPPVALPPRKRATPRGAAASSPAPRLTVGEPPGGVDRATWQRFRGGKLAAERTLDLHGYTAQRAFHALTAFLRAAHADQVRCVEVVTGRGSGDAPGVLRRELPLWLNLPDIRALVLAAAHPHAANPGAVRLLLRRVR